MERFHEILLSSAFGLSGGLVSGLIISSIRRKQVKNPTEKQQEFLLRIARKVMRLLSQGVYVVLALALIWTMYFLVLGLVDTTVTDWAADASSLIVSFATIFSIIIAFYEFTKRGKE